MNTDKKQPPLSPESGTTLVELMIAVVMLTIAVLGMVQMSVVARQQSRAGELATDMWSVAQVQLENLRAVDFDSLSSGSGTSLGHPISWNVAGTDPKTLTLAVTRPGVTGGTAVDTFVVVVADWGS